MRFAGIYLLLIAPVLACSATSGQTDPNDESADELQSACRVGAKRCSDPHQIERCEAVSGRSPRFVRAERCENGNYCRDGECAAPTDRQHSQAASLHLYLETMRNSVAWHQPIDLNPTLEREQARLLSGDGTDKTFYAAIWRTLHEIKEGHQSIWSDTACGSVQLPNQHTSHYGVCARPAQSGLVITFAQPNNALGLKAGDRIMSAGGARGAAILDEAAMRPVCGGYYPSAESRRSSAAASFFATVPAGTSLDVLSPSGRRRNVVVPPVAADARPLDCGDPLGRERDFNAQATRLPDGTGLIRLPRFYPIGDVSHPQTNEEFFAFMERFRATIKTEFDKVKDAPRLIWDARGNSGGMTVVGLSIVAGMPSARAVPIAQCNMRVPGSNPPEFMPELSADYAVTPGGDFAYSGKTAVLIDGLNYSAADYFAYAVKNATNVVLVGERTAGAYGGGSDPFAIPGPPSMGATYNAHRCLDASGNALEGRGVEPTVRVSYKPADLARGVDSVLEAAIARLR